MNEPPLSDRQRTDMARHFEGLRDAVRDGLGGDREQQWPPRRDALGDLLRHHTATLLAQRLHRAGEVACQA